MSGNPGTSQMTAAQANAIGRSVLLQSGIKMSRIVTQGAALSLGQPTRINLFRTGITTGVLLDVTAQYNVTVAMTPSPAGPWPLFNQIKYTDFSGVDRTNVDGLGLWLVNTMKYGELVGNAVPGVIPAIGSVNGNLLEHGTAVSSTQEINFSLYVPLSVDPMSDLRGAVPSMTNVGEHYITIVPCNNLVSATDVLAAPFTAGTATLNFLTVDVTQFYIQPQSIAASALPGIDLSTIYEISGRWATTSGFQSNGQVLINYPNDRSILSATHVFENGGALQAGEAGVAKLEMLVNSNTVFRELTPRAIRGFMRSHAKADVPSSVFYWSHRQQPILTQLYATVQSRYTLNTINAGVTQMVATYESVYPSGQPLAGITPNG